MNNIKDILFDSDTHTYHYHGRQLKGITQAIGVLTSHSMSNAKSLTLQLACEYGTTTHIAVSDWIMHGEKPCIESAIWVVDYFNRQQTERQYLQSELLVSDFEYTASAIDIVQHTDKGVILYDIKTGNFMRDYCTLQLNAYRYLYKLCYGLDIISMHVLGTKKQRVYDILPIDDKQVKDLLAFNKKL